MLWRRLGGWCGTVRAHKQIEAGVHEVMSARDGFGSSGPLEYREISGKVLEAYPRSRRRRRPLAPPLDAI
jgi:hypothetical protein